MVTIWRKGRTLTVTRGAFECLYKPLGYVLVAGPGEDHSTPQEPAEGICTPYDEAEYTESPGSYNDDYLSGSAEQEEITDSEPEPEEPEAEETLSEKPIGEMSFKELKEYASSLGLNANGFSSKRELKAAIKQYLS